MISLKICDPKFGCGIFGEGGREVVVQDVRSLKSLRVCVPSIESEVLGIPCSWCQVYKLFVVFSLKYFRFFIQCVKSLNSLRVYVLKNDCDIFGF